MSQDPSWFPDVLAVFNKVGVPTAVWVPIMLHESGANPNAENNTLGKTTAPGTVPEWSVGLFQINVAAKFPGDTAKQADLAKQLKDPVTNAQYAAYAMAGAWAAVKDQAQNTPVEYWPWLVGVRSGWPAGSVSFPCVSDYCNSLKEGFAGVARRYQAALTASGDVGGILAPWFDFKNGGTTPPPSPTGTAPGTGDQSAYNSVTTAPGYFGGGGSSSGGGSGGGGSSSTPASGINLTQIGPAVSLWLHTDAALNVLFFVLGMGLLAVAVMSLAFEKTQSAGQAVLNNPEIKTAIKAALVA